VLPLALGWMAVCVLELAPVVGITGVRGSIRVDEVVCGAGRRRMSAASRWGGEHGNKQREPRPPSSPHARFDDGPSLRVPAPMFRAAVCMGVSSN